MNESETSSCFKKEGEAREAKEIYSSVAIVLFCTWERAALIHDLS